MNPNHVIAVFGCGGDRDRTKRPIMGRIGAELADILSSPRIIRGRKILTPSSPKSEGVKQDSRPDSTMKSSSIAVKPFIAPNWHKKNISSSLPAKVMKRIRS